MLSLEEYTKLAAKARTYCFQYYLYPVGKVEGGIHSDPIVRSLEDES